ncbi:unnamed protein product [Prunus armeniaca]|uniref:Cytochrome P450 n=1 Tax=Prunus armeniaca TaxID=36596 RepID=A0A6J5Y4E5_PRUAR|nr:unnamed protein product [Prunus armeniaca]
MGFLQCTSISSAVSTYLFSFPFYIIIALATSIGAYFFIHLHDPKNWKDSPPGPVGWPILGSLPHLLNNRLHEDLFHLSRIHGPLFSLKLGLKPQVVILSLKMARKTLKQQEYVFSSRTITEAIQIFSAKAFEPFEPVHKQQVHGLLKQLYLPSMMKNSVNIAEFVSWPQATL